MELNLSLRSLEAAGRPSGTGRSSLPAARENENPRADREGPLHEDPHAERRETTQRETESSDAHARRAAPRKRSDSVRAEQDPSASGGDPSVSEQPVGEHEGGPRLAFEGELRARTLERASARPTPARSVTASAGAAQVEATAEGVELPAPSVTAEIAEAQVLAAGTTIDVEQRADPVEALMLLQHTAAEDLADAPVLGEEDLALEASTPVVEEGSVEGTPIRIEPASSAPAQTVQAARTTAPETAAQGSVREIELLDASSAAAEAAPEPRATPRPDETRASEILRQVRVAISPRFEQAVIQLHPAELGRISIQLRVEKDGLVAQVRAEKREALEALEKHIPELRAALARQGIQAGEFDLALGFHDERKSGDARGGRPHRTRERDSHAGLEEALTNTRALRRILTEGAIDTYA